MKGINGEISNADELPLCEISPYSRDDMLGIEPLELHFAFELNKDISSSLELSNQTNANIAFNINTISPLPYCIEPIKGIVLPRSKCSVKMTLKSQEKAPKYMQQAYAFILQSTKAKEGLAAEDINANIFKEEAGNVVDEVNLDVVFDSAQLQSDIIDVHQIKACYPLERDNFTPIVFSLEFLKAITHGFSTKCEIGRGGFGVVYKGVLPSGKFIAVKKLFRTHILDKETFENEIRCLNGIKHQNVVKFVGYCAQSSYELIDQPRGKPIWTEITERLICLEYVPNKSLYNFISDESSGLEWNMRYEIIKGICSGLHFLHEECHIIHLDLKPANILMDAAMMPKIGDFAFSRPFDNMDETHTMSISGTRGYMPPEFIRGTFSLKSDIYSFGVIVIELLTGYRDYPYDEDTSTHQYYSEMVLGSWRKKFLSTPKYNKLVEEYMLQVKQCIDVGLKCVYSDRHRRPTVKDIMQELTAVGL